MITIVRRLPRSLLLGLATLTAAMSVSTPGSLAAAHHPASEFALTGADGRPVRMADYRGQVVLINFWASWCAPCREEMPILDRIHQRYKALGFTVIGVNADENPADGAKQLAATPVSFPVGFDPHGMVSTVYAVDSMPCTVIVDRKGDVRLLHRGYQPGSEDEYVEQIKALVKE